MTAYEFRCPFGLVFDETRLLCEWPWLVPNCGNGTASGLFLGIYQPTQYVYGNLAHGIEVLDHYDGLGSLSKITLGGLSGPLQQPEAKIYSSSLSNVNSLNGITDFSLGSNNIHQTNNFDVHAFNAQSNKRLDAFGAAKTGAQVGLSFQNNLFGLGNINLPESSVTNVHGGTQTLHGSDSARKLSLDSSYLVNPTVQSYINHGTKSNIDAIEVLQQNNHQDSIISTQASGFNFNEKAVGNFEGHTDQQSAGVAATRDNNSLKQLQGNRQILLEAAITNSNGDLFQGNGPKISHFGTDFHRQGHSNQFDQAKLQLIHQDNVNLHSSVGQFDNGVSYQNEQKTLTQNINNFGFSGKLSDSIISKGVFTQKTHTDGLGILSPISVNKNGKQFESHINNVGGISVNENNLHNQDILNTQVLEEIPQINNEDYGKKVSNYNFSTKKNIFTFSQPQQILTHISHPITPPNTPKVFNDHNRDYTETVVDTNQRTNPFVINHVSHGSGIYNNEKSSDSTSSNDNSFKQNIYTTHVAEVIPQINNAVFGQKVSNYNGIITENIATTLHQQPQQILIHNPSVTVSKISFGSQNRNENDYSSQQFTDTAEQARNYLQINHQSEQQNDFSNQHGKLNSNSQFNFDFGKQQTNQQHLNEQGNTYTVASKEKLGTQSGGAVGFLSSTVTPTYPEIHHTILDGSNINSNKQHNYTIKHKQTEQRFNHQNIGTDYITHVTPDHTEGTYYQSSNIPKRILDINDELSRVGQKFSSHQNSNIFAYDNKQNNGFITDSMLSLGDKTYNTNVDLNPQLSHSTQSVSINHDTKQINGQDVEKERFKYNIPVGVVSFGIKYENLRNSHQGGLGSQEAVTHSPNNYEIGNSFVENTRNLGNIQNSFAISHEANKQSNEKIDIIRGGYSAVGIPVSAIQITHDGVNVQSQSTVTPITVVTATSIPVISSVPIVTPVRAVTSVPVPTIKTSTKFESFNGGVVANIPELQYKIPFVSNSNRGTTKFNNTSAHFFNYVSSTTATPTFTGYHYPKPTLQFVEDQQVINEENYNQGLNAHSTVSFNIQHNNKDHSQNSKYEPIDSNFEGKISQIKTVTIPTSNHKYEDKSQQHFISVAPNLSENPLQTGGAFSYDTPFKTVINGQVLHTQDGKIHQQQTSPQHFKTIPRIHESKITIPETYLTPLEEKYIQPAIISDFSISHKNPEQISFVSQENSENDDSAFSKDNIETNQKNIGGYIYEKPLIPFNEEPVDLKNFKPAILEENFKPQIPTIEYKTHEKIPVGYNYPKPTITFEEEPHLASKINKEGGFEYSFGDIKKIRPISSHVFSEIEETANNANKKTLSTPTYQYEQPAVDVVPTKSYSYKQKEITNIYKTINKNVAPAHSFVFHQTEQVTPSPLYQVTQKWNKPAVISYDTSTNNGAYTIKQNIKNTFGGQTESSGVSSTIKPTIPTSFSYEKSNTHITYDNSEPVKEEPFISKAAYVTGYDNQNGGYVYEKPAIKFEESPINYQSHTNPETLVYYSTSKPSTRRLGFRVKSGKSRVIFDNVSTLKPSYQSTISSIVETKIAPTKYYISSTPTPFIQSTTIYPSSEIPVTQSKPISKYSFSSFDKEYHETPTVYIPATSTENYLDIKTPLNDYLPVAKENLETYSSLSNKNNFNKEIYTITTPQPTYLPSYDEKYVLSTRKTFPNIKPAKTIIKVDDYHPFLSTKLGAQCTCVSNVLKIRKRPIHNDGQELNKDDEFVVVGRPVKGNQRGRTIIENYELHEPNVNITPKPETFYHSTPNSIQSARVPAYVIKKRITVRPVTSTTVPYERIYKLHNETEDVEKINQNQQSDKNIADAVRTGLSLVKNAVKEGVKEGVKEVIQGRNFDRYGPGGWRSKDETLQGIIDCQRAGLFRHPTQCNKFYTCRWDCTKNRYTLHVFNCPVHLTFDNDLGACNWPSQGPACVANTLLPSD